MADQSIQIEPGWHAALQEEFAQPYFAAIKQKLVDDRRQGYTIYPPANLIFNAFNRAPFERVKVVILGQDPYHGPGQAHGLCFSVPRQVKTPPSLKNIYKEQHDDLGITQPAHGNLESWADQGILLLNAFLTVRAGQAASHSKIGWEKFTDAAIRKLSEERAGIVFLLWGGFARKKKALIHEDRHHILQAAHPSPLSAHNGFFGCRHFSKTNELLQHQGFNPINWQLPE